MNDEDNRVYASAPTVDEAHDAVEKKAIAKWGEGNFTVTVKPNPSENFTTHEVLLYTAFAENTKTDLGGSA